MLKAALVKLETQLIEESAKSAGAGTAFDVVKSGDARVCLFGFPSVGKSSLLSKITDHDSQIGEYDFTTVTAIPAMLRVNGVSIQLIDLPGILAGASSGFGKGKQVLGVIRSADLIAFVIDSAKADQELSTLYDELHTFGIRVNELPPNVIITPMVKGGVSFDIKCQQTHLELDEMKSIATASKFRSGSIQIYEDITSDRLIDSFNITHLKYIPAMFIYNKVDTLCIEDIDRLARLPRSVVASVLYDLGLEGISQKIFTMLNITRVYTKSPGCPPDLEEAVLLKQGSTVRDLCMKIHKSMIDNFRGAIVWGRSVKRQGQVVKISHVLEDEDVITIKTAK